MFRIITFLILSITSLSGDYDTLSLQLNWFPLEMNRIALFCETFVLWRTEKKCEKHWIVTSLTWRIYLLFLLSLRTSETLLWDILFIFDYSWKNFNKLSVFLFVKIIEFGLESCIGSGNRFLYETARNRCSDRIGLSFDSYRSWSG